MGEVGGLGERCCRGGQDVVFGGVNLLVTQRGLVRGVCQMEKCHTPNDATRRYKRTKAQFVLAVTWGHQSSCGS